MGSVISSCTFFYLVGCQVVRWYFGNLSHQFSDSKWPEVYVLVVDMPQLPSPGYKGCGLSFCKTTQVYASGYHLQVVRWK